MPPSFLDGGRQGSGVHRCGAGGPHPEVRQEFDVARRSAQRRRHHRHRCQAGRGGQRRGHIHQHPQVDGRVRHEPAPADLRPARLELRLDEEHAVGAVARDAGQGRSHEPERDERQVGDEQVDGIAHVGRGEVAGVAAFPDGDPGVVAERPGQLAGPHVDGQHRGGAALQEAVREPAGGGAGVEGPEAGHVDGEPVECGVQLLAAAGNEAGGRRLEMDGLVGGHETPRPVRPSP